MREIGKQALVGFLIGGTGGLGGAAIAGRFLLAGVQGGAAQIGDNLLHGRAWSEDVLQSAGIGVATMGLSAGGGAALRRVLNRAGASVIGDGERSAVGSASGQPLSADTTAAIRPGRLGNVDHRAEVVAGDAVGWAYIAATTPTGSPSPLIAFPILTDPSN